MAAFDNINYAALADKFQKFYDIFNATMTALKAGASGYLLTGSGAGTAPTFQPIWSAWIVIGSGGPAPAFGAGFAQTSNPADQLRIRYSSLLNIAQLNGRFERTGTNFAPASAAGIFSIGPPYLPVRPQNSIIKLGSTNENMSLLLDPSTGQFIGINTTGTTLLVGGFVDINMEYPLS